MNFYVTTGTADFLLKMIEKHPNEKLFLLQGQEKAALLHETTGKTIFSLPKKYEVADEYGELTQKGFFAIYHLSIEGSRREVMKHQFIQQAASLKREPSLMSYRLLMPKKNSEHILFISQWGGPASYEVWTQSSEYNDIFQPLFELKSTSVQNIFDGKSYIATYSAYEFEEAE